MLTPNRQAPASPDIEPRWTSSAKTGFGKTLSNKSRVCFTLGHGIFNEIYYPRIDQACVRDMVCQLSRCLPGTTSMIKSRGVDRHGRNGFLL